MKQTMGFHDKSAFVLGALQLCMFDADAWSGCFRLSQMKSITEEHLDELSFFDMTSGKPLSGKRHPLMMLVSEVSYALVFRLTAATVNKLTLEKGSQEFLGWIYNYGEQANGQLSVEFSSLDFSIHFPSTIYPNGHDDFALLKTICENRKMLYSNDNVELTIDLNK